MAPKSQKSVSKPPITTISITNTFRKLNDYLKKQGYEQGDIPSPPMLVSLKTALNAQQRKGTTLETKFIECLFDTLENGMYCRLSSSIFSAIVEIILQTDYCLKIERCLHLLVSSLHSKDKTDKVEQALMKKKKSIGSDCMILLLGYFVDTTNTTQVRLWVGMLCIQLVYKCRKNCDIIEFGPESIRRGLGPLLTQDKNDIIKYICARFMRTALDSELDMKHMWPENTDKRMYESFPPSTEKDSGWSWKVQAYLDKLHDILGTPKSQSQSQDGSKKNISIFYCAYGCEMKPYGDLAKFGTSLNVLLEYENITIHAPRAPKGQDGLLVVAVSSIIRIKIVHESPSQNDNVGEFIFYLAEGRLSHLNGEEKSFQSITLAGSLRMISGLRDELLAISPDLEVANSPVEELDNSHKSDREPGFMPFDSFDNPVMDTQTDSDDEVSVPHFMVFASRDAALMVKIDGNEARNANLVSALNATQKGRPLGAISDTQDVQPSLIEGSPGDDRGGVKLYEPQEPNSYFQEPEEDLYNASPPKKSSQQKSMQASDEENEIHREVLVFSSVIKEEGVSLPLASSSTRKEASVKPKAKVPITISQKIPSQKETTDLNSAKTSPQNPVGVREKYEINDLSDLEEHDASTPKVNVVQKEARSKKRSALPKATYGKRFRPSLKNGDTKASPKTKEAVEKASDVFDIPMDGNEDNEANRTKGKKAAVPKTKPKKVEKPKKLTKVESQTTHKKTADAATQEAPRRNPKMVSQDSVEHVGVFERTDASFEGETTSRELRLTVVNLHRKLATTESAQEIVTKEGKRARGAARPAKTVKAQETVKAQAYPKLAKTDKSCADPITKDTTQLDAKMKHTQEVSLPSQTAKPKASRKPAGYTKRSTASVTKDAELDAEMHHTQEIDRPSQAAKSLKPQKTTGASKGSVAPVTMDTEFGDTEIQKASENGHRSQTTKAHDRKKPGKASKTPAAPVTSDTNLNDGEAQNAHEDAYQPPTAETQACKKDKIAKISTAPASKKTEFEDAEVQDAPDGFHHASTAKAKKADARFAEAFSSVLEEDDVEVEEAEIPDNEDEPEALRDELAHTTPTDSSSISKLSTTGKTDQADKTKVSSPVNTSATLFTRETGSTTSKKRKSRVEEATPSNKRRSRIEALVVQPSALSVDNKVPPEKEASKLHHPNPTRSSKDNPMPLLVNDHSARKTTLISFNLKGPLNQGRSIANESKPALRVGGNLEADALEKKRKRQESDLPESQIPPPKRQYSSPRDQSAENDDAPIITSSPPVLAIDQTIAQPRPARPFVTSQGSRAYSQGSRVGPDGSPLAPRSIEKVDHISHLEEKLKKQAIPGKDADQHIISKIQPRSGYDIFGPKVRLGSQPKQRPSSPDKSAPRYVPHHKNQNGHYEGIATKEVVQPQKSLPDPFLETSRRSSGFTERLRNGSGAPPEKIQKVQQIINRQGLIDAEKTTVNDENQFNQSLPSMSNGSSSDTNGSEIHGSPLQEISANQTWNMALRPHYNSLQDAVHRVADEMVIRLSNEEDKMNLLVKQYKESSTMMIENVAQKRSVQKSKMIHSLLEKKNAVVRAYTETKQAIRSTTEDEKDQSVGAMEKEWRVKQNRVREKIAAGMRRLSTD